MVQEGVMRWSHLAWSIKIQARLSYNHSFRWSRRESCSLSRNVALWLKLLQLDWPPWRMNGAWSAHETLGNFRSRQPRAALEWFGGPSAGCKKGPLGHRVCLAEYAKGCDYSRGCFQFTMVPASLGWRTNAIIFETIFNLQWSQPRWVDEKLRL